MGAIFCIFLLVTGCIMGVIVLRLSWNSPTRLPPAEPKRPRHIYLVPKEPAE
jgi:hypothetical protein